MDGSNVEIRCWAECQECGKYRGRASIATNDMEWSIECEQSHDTPEAAELEAMREVERRLLG